MVKNKCIVYFLGLGEADYFFWKIQKLSADDPVRRSFPSCWASQPGDEHLRRVSVSLPEIAVCKSAVSPPADCSVCNLNLVGVRNPQTVAQWDVWRITRRPPQVDLQTARSMWWTGQTRQSAATLILPRITTQPMAPPLFLCFNFHKEGSAGRRQLSHDCGDKKKKKKILGLVCLKRYFHIVAADTDVIKPLRCSNSIRSG